MPTITFDAHGFPRSWIRRQGVLTVSWQHIARAAVSLGTTHGPWSGAIGPHGALEMIWRVALVRANLSTDRQDRIIATDEFWSLDPSEKGAVTFFLGQVSMKLFADTMGVPAVARVDEILRAMGRKLRGSRPDFYGIRPHAGSVAIEVKGRTHPIDTPTIDRAKAQAASLPRVLHTGVHRPYVHAAHFYDGAWKALLRDPESTGEESGPTAADILLAYYRPLAAAITDGDLFRQVDISGRQYYTRHLYAVDLTVGLQVGFVDAALRGGGGDGLELLGLFNENDQPGDRHLTFGDMKRLSLGESEQRQSIGRDGVLVQTGTAWQGSLGTDQ